MEAQELIALSIKYQGDYHALLKALLNEEKATLERPVQAITILDADYPSLFRELANPPLVLFYKGNRALLKEKTVAVIGSRNASAYALRMTGALCKELKKKYTIVSGLAKGIDAAAHRSALDAKTIAVLGNGIDYIYPLLNKELTLEIAEKQLLLSEYPGKVLPLAAHFPFRNRLIAALGTKVFVMQSSSHSGTLTTVNEALNLNRDIYALPFAIDDPCGYGTNMLIAEGANLILTEYFKEY